MTCLSYISYKVEDVKTKPEENLFEEVSIKNTDNNKNLLSILFLIYDKKACITLINPNVNL